MRPTGANPLRSDARLAGLRGGLFCRPAPVRLFHLFGIDFTANWTWLFLFALLVYVAYLFFSVRLVFAQQVLGALATMAAVLSVLCLYAHELAHAIVARLYGIPVRTISLFLLGGMAHITRESPSPRAEFLIAIAGPLTSIAVGRSEEHTSEL